MASIREVAKLAGVSPATVSRVINETANVDTEKKERVLRAIKETGFTPNEVARSLYKRSARTIGFIVPSITNPFFTQMASAVEQTAQRNGYRMILCNSGGDVETEKSSISMLASMNVDGVILTTSNKELKTYLDSCRTPIVTIDRLISNHVSGGYIHCDHYKGGRLAMEHLIKCGCRHVVCIRGLESISSASERYRGYADVCKEYRMAERSIICDYDYHEGLRMTQELLDRYPDVDGIIAANDMVALSVYKVLQRKGIRVPKQIQLVGYDNVYLSELMTPALTTVAQPIAQMGEKAAELLIHRDETSKTGKEYVFEPDLIVRETTVERRFV